MQLNKLFRGFCLLALGMMFMSVSALAQKNDVRDKPTYKTAIGVKYAPFAVSLKLFSGKKNRAFEMLGDFDDGFRLTALYEFHGDLTASRNLKWYIGGGAHGGYYDKGEVDGAMFGLDAVAGLDYKFVKLPLNISLDWQPAYEFITPGTEFQAGRGGLAVRLAF